MRSLNASIASQNNTTRVYVLGELLTSGPSVVGLRGPFGLMVNDAFQQCNSQFNETKCF